MKRLILLSTILMALVLSYQTNSYQETLRQLTHCTPENVDHPKHWNKVMWISGDVSVEYSLIDKAKYSGGYWIVRNFMKSRGTHSSYMDIEQFRNNPIYSYIGTLTGYINDSPAVNFEVYLNSDYYYYFIRAESGCTIKSFTSGAVNWGGYCYYVSWVNGIENYNWAIPRLNNDMSGYTIEPVVPSELYSECLEIYNFKY